MTAAANDDDVVRRLRRLAGIVLIGVALAGGGALALGLRQSSGARPATTSAAAIFPVTFSQPGFVSGAVHEADMTVRPPETLRLSRALELPAGATGWVVARCDTGRVTVRIGAAVSTQRCVGRPAGVVAFAAAPHGLAVVATVSARQQTRWGVAIYR